MQPELGIKYTNRVNEDLYIQKLFNAQDIIQCFKEHTRQYLNWEFNPKACQHAHLNPYANTNFTANAHIEEPDLMFQIDIYDSTLAIYINLSNTDFMKHQADIRGGNSILNVAACNLLSKYIKPNIGENICDPMCGHGNIVRALLKNYPMKSIIAGDKDKMCIEKTEQLILDMPKYKNVKLNVWDVINMPLNDNSIDNIITEFPVEIEINNNTCIKYKAILKSFARVVKRGYGRAMIISPPACFDRVLESDEYWDCSEIEYISCSDNKVYFYILKRNPKTVRKSDNLNEMSVIKIKNKQQNNSVPNKSNDVSINDYPMSVLNDLLCNIEHQIPSKNLYLKTSSSNKQCFHNDKTISRNSCNGNSIYDRGILSMEAKGRNLSNEVKRLHISHRNVGFGPVAYNCKQNKNDLKIQMENKSGDGAPSIGKKMTYCQILKNKGHDESNCNRRCMLQEQQKDVNYVYSQYINYFINNNEQKQKVFNISHDKIL